MSTYPSRIEEGRTALVYYMVWAAALSSILYAALLKKERTHFHLYTLEKERLEKNMSVHPESRF